jgi:predicted site-specific integrase-resolvase
MDRSLYSLESRFLFLESALKRDYEKETMTALYALISSSENKDETVRILAELMRDISDDEVLLKRANERLGR